MGDLGAKYFGMSGSGSSFFAAFDSPDETAQAQRHLTQRFDGAEIYRCRPTTVGHWIRETG
jgi:4-diphosphocytidyl-2C-methyl-D-erythritol kinase